MSRLLPGPDPVKIPPSCWFLFASIFSVPPRRHSSSISLSSRKQMAFLWGPWSWEYRSELLSDSFLPLVMSADVLNRVREALQLDVPTSLPAIPSWSSIPAPPLRYWHLLPQVTEFTWGGPIYSHSLLSDPFRGLQPHRSSVRLGVTCLSSRPYSPLRVLAGAQ